MASKPGCACAGRCGEGLPRLSGLMVRVELVAGLQVDEAIASMCSLAGRLGAAVVADLNDVLVVANPGDDPRALLADWHERLDRVNGWNSDKEATA